MSTFFKVMLALLVALPIGAYFAGAVVASREDDADDTRLVRVEHSASPDDDHAPNTPAPADETRTEPSDTPDSETSDSGDSENWQDESGGASEESDHSQDGDSDEGDPHDDEGDHEDHEDD